MIGDVWRRYRGRKSKKGIVIDFLFLVLLLVVVCGPIRRGILTYLVRATLIEPVVYDKILFVCEEDSFVLRTSGGMDTVITFPPERPVLLNVGSIWSPQTRAELRSLNGFAERYAGRVDVCFISTDAREDAISYLDREGYGALVRLFARELKDDEEEELEELGVGIFAEMALSEPASILVDREGQVIIKKMGAAKWEGENVDEAVNMVVGE